MFGDNFVYLPAICALLFCLLCYVCDEWEKQKDVQAQPKSLLDHSKAFLTPLMPLILLLLVVDLYWKLTLASRRRQQVIGGGGKVGEEEDKNADAPTATKKHTSAKSSFYMRASTASAQAS